MLVLTSTKVKYINGKLFYGEYSLFFFNFFMIWISEYVQSVIKIALKTLTNNTELFNLIW